MATSSDERTVGRFARAPSLQSHLFSLPDLRDRPYSEALFTTFNVDLGYFEQHVLGTARASGAAVTVIADGSQYQPDPLAVHGAGSSYVVGVVDLPTAFHPKVNVLVGDDRLLVAIGSGNLTSGGWLGNDETIFVAQGQRLTGIPGIAAGVANWLASIETLSIGVAGQAGIERTREAIENLLASSVIVDTGHRLVTSSMGPILDQLPEGQVDDLFLCAPFHDHSGAALGKLLDRFRPRSVSIAVQPGRTIIDPTELAAVAQSHGVELTWHDAGTAYRHGKVIEAVSGESRWTLAGSPNLTGAALLRSLGAGGNSEVGVVTMSGQSLYPGEGSPLRTVDIPKQKILAAPGEAPRPADEVPILLGATLDGGAVVVELSRPATVPITVEVGEYSDLPELSYKLGQVPVGAAEARLDSVRDLGARSRVRISFDMDGSWHRGPFHFLVDPGLALQRVTARRSATSNTDVDWRALFGDDNLLRDWTRTLDKVTREQRALPAVAATSMPWNTSMTVGSVSNGRAFDDEEAWAQYSEDAIARLGPTLAHETSGGLILPHLAIRGAGNSTSSGPIWVDKFDADASDFDDTQTADDLDVDHEIESDTDGSGPGALVPPQQQQRFRSWIRGLARDVGGRPALDRMAITRLTLIASLARVWDEDAEWFSYLRDASRSLAKGDVPPRLASEAGALVSVCLYRLNQGASPDRRTGTGLDYVRVVEELAPLVVDLDVDRVTSIVHSVYGTSAVTTHPQDVVDLVTSLTDSNPWPGIVDSIERSKPGWVVDLEADRRITIEARSGSHFKIAAETLEFVPRGLTVAIRVTVGRQLEELIFARHDDVLAVQHRLGSRLVWKTYRLSGLVSPSVIQASPQTEVSVRIDRAPWPDISVAARTVLDAAGVTP